MKLLLIVLTLLGWPLVTWWLETRGDGKERRNINRMADRDRKRQAQRPMHRRNKYSQNIKPALLEQHGLGRNGSAWKNAR